MMSKGNQRFGLAIIAGIVIILLSSCNISKKYEKEEEQNIQTYLANHSSLAFEKKASGLYYMDTQIGEGQHVATHDSVFVMYIGYYLNDDMFYSNYTKKDTLKFKAGENEVISGFDEAITYMNAGGKAKILVPSYLAYGTSGYGMPAYTTLVFDVYVVRLKPYSGTK
jgi:FKBP-type peptidyl-prolyl cis-trans isomerase